MSPVTPKLRKVAVIGTSNIGAVKYAQDQITKDHPTLEVTCYGLPGGKFNDAHIRKSAFGPARSDRAAMKIARRVNGAATLDLAPFSHILVIADTLGLPSTLWTALNYDIADWPTRTDRDLLSLPAFRAAIAQAIATRADHLRTQFGDLPLHVALAPYPTTAVVPKGVHHQKPYAGMATHPHGAEIEALYRAALSDALATRSMTWVPQPQDTIAAPFLTKEPYGHGAMDFRSKDRALDDHRHMNADFGASLFKAFAIALSQVRD